MARFTGGWYKLHRNILEKDLAQNIYLWALWHYLLSIAVYKESQLIVDGKQRKLQPGQLVFSPRGLADIWKINHMTVWKWLKYLKETERVVYETYTRGTIVTICNWSLYQITDDDTYTPGIHQVDTGYTPDIREVDASYTPGSTYKESTEGKNEKKKEIKNSNAGIRIEYPEEFDTLWLLYCRKGDKKAAFIEYKKLNLDNGQHENLSTAIQNYFKSQSDPKFRKDFERFLKTDWREWLKQKDTSNGIHPKTQERLNTFETWKAMVEAREGIENETQN